MSRSRCFVTDDLVCDRERIFHAPCRDGIASEPDRDAVVVSLETLNLGLEATVATNGVVARGRLCLTITLLAESI